MYPVKVEHVFISTLQAFNKYVGVPSVLVCNGAKTQTKIEVKDFANKFGTTLRVLENETKWADRAELYIELIKYSTRKDTRETHSVLVLWYYAMERRVIIHQAKSKDMFQMNGTNPHTATFGTEADISNIFQYGWYVWVYYRDQQTSSPQMKECLGWCLGPANNKGNEMAQWILTGNVHVVPRRDIFHLTKAELDPSNEMEQRKHTEFYASIINRLVDSFALPPTTAPDIAHARGNEVNPRGDYFEPYLDDEETPAFVPQSDILDASGKPIFAEIISDTLINAEVSLPHGEMNGLATVVKNSVDNNGKKIGSWNDNTMLNTLVYGCEFSDGTV